MGMQTDIAWCDSSLNLQMGCDGCELWNPKKGIRRCYAGVLTGRYGGRAGWPESFDKPELFLHRLDAALRWKDLTGTERPKKPWLNGLPRIVFLDDMGDTFTESLPLHWLAPLLPRMADSPHVWMLLTKRGKRMRQFSEAHPLPANVWPGVSITTRRTLARVQELLAVQGGGVKWVSAEPLLEEIRLPTQDDFSDFGHGCAWLHKDGVSFVIIGGESGRDTRPCNVDWIRALAGQCKAAGVPAFLKQLGSRPFETKRRCADCGGDGEEKIPCEPGDTRCEFCDGRGYHGGRLHLRDAKGGDPAEWPEDLQDCRQFPAAPTTAAPPR